MLSTSTSILSFFLIFLNYRSLKLLGTQYSMELMGCYSPSFTRNSYSSIKLKVICSQPQRIIEIYVSYSFILSVFHSNLKIS